MEASEPSAATSDRTLIRSLVETVGQTVTLQGWVHARRDLGGIQFLMLRDRSGLVQVVFENTSVPMQESSVSIEGSVVANARAPGGIEVHGTGIRTISLATAPPPIEIAKEEWQSNPETLLEYRHVSLRGTKAKAILKVQAELVGAFRSYLDEHDFTEIFTPKLVAAGAEGGANLFEVDYYGKRAYLAQSPQLYKQIMVGVFERVYEAAPVYRAEQSHTVRHLSEYLSLDVEMGFINDEKDVMDLEEDLLRSMMAHVGERCGAQLAVLGAAVPDMSRSIPRVPLFEARAIVAERYGHRAGGKDLDPEAERLIGRWALEEHGSEFVFVTKYPQAARPFYTYPEPGGVTRGLDLIFRGTEITSGGQRIHEHAMLIQELANRKMDVEQFQGYLEVFKHGMPPHGGFAIGAERLTALLLGVPNIRFARAFPRDGSRLQP